MYKAIIFDLDGTVLNTIEDITDSLNAALKDTLDLSVTIDECKYFVGSGVDKLIERVLDHFNKDTFDNFGKLKTKYLHYYKLMQTNKTKPYQNITDVLRLLKKNNYKIGVVSNKPDDDTVKVISQYFGDGLFDEVCGKKEGYTVKPNPRAVNEMIQTWGLSKEEVIYCGDSDVDIYTALNAEIDIISVTWGFRKKEELTLLKPTYIIDEVMGILKILNCNL